MPRKKKVVKETKRKYTKRAMHWRKPELENLRDIIRDQADEIIELRMTIARLDAK